jgi:ABC-type molybdate transport system ATPase subunit
VVIETRVAAQGMDGPSRLAFRDAQIDVSRRDERVGARVRGGIHARDVGLALQAQIKAVALLA